VLRADLVALGLSPQEIAAVPACSAAAQVAQSSALALGSLYVVEGSRRGGQVIAQALRDASWLPPQGLTYFDDRSSTGAWHHLAATLDQSLWDQADPEIGGGALLTFEVLRGWLTESVIE
jgi:heme oxygenase